MIGKLGVVDAVTSSTAYEIGNEGRLLETTDGGAQWSTVTAVPGAGGLVDVVFFDPSDGVVLTDSQLWNTTDGGRSWSQTTPKVHEAPLPPRGNGHLDPASLPAPLDAAARSVEAETSVPPEAPFVLPPSLSATASAARDHYSVSLFECPTVFRFGAPGIGKGTCAGPARWFGTFGGQQEASPGSARAVVREDAARPSGCPTGRKLTHQVALNGDVVQVRVAGTSSLCAFTWKHGRWAVQVLGDITSNRMETAVLPPLEQLANWPGLPGSAGILMIHEAADGSVHVLARWSRGSAVYHVSTPATSTDTTLTRTLPLVSDMTPISSR